MILVTGGSGLVGAHLIKALVEQGKTVKALYRSVVPFLDGCEQVEWVKGDILDVIVLAEVLKDVDEVFHCAAIVSYDPRMKNEMFSINIEGTKNIINACLQAEVKKLCYVSSVAALGKMSEGAEIDETASWNEKAEHSNYAKSKYLAEMEVWRGIGEGLDAVIVNPSIILGSADWTKGSTGLFKSAYDEFPWYTEGVTGFVDVADVVRAMIALMEVGVTGERFILSAQNRKYKEVFTAIARGFNKRPPHKKVNKLMAEVVWRAETLKALFTNKPALLTRETARSAQALVHYNNGKINKVLPSFKYTPLEETIERICNELKQRNKL